MPRPKNGYVNAAGEQVPGVHDITGRYGDKNCLIHWAYGQGKAGVPLYEKGTLDIGTVVHKMAELDLRGAPEREIERVPHDMLSTPADIDKAFQAFRAFQEWRKEHDVRAIAFEEALVSEQWGYGGTFDCVAWVDGVRSLIDFKTCKTAGQVYLEQRLVMAAHGHLWHEAHPDLPLAGYHLINLPKDGSKFGHHAFADLSPEFEMFTLQLDCWRIEKGLTRKRTTKPATVVPAPKAALVAEQSVAAQPAPCAASKTDATPADASKPKRTRKPKADKAPVPAEPAVTAVPIAPPVLVEAPAPVPVQIVMETIAPPPPVQLTMAEILRSYGHVREAA